TAGPACRGPAFAENDFVGAKQKKARSAMESALPLIFKSLQQRAVLWLSPQRIAKIQCRRLRRLVARAQKELPFYAARLAHIDPENFTLDQLPTVTKPEMMANFDCFLTDRRITRTGVEEFMRDPARLGQWYLDKYAVSHTSGTGGLQAFIVQDRNMMRLLF